MPGEEGQIAECIKEGYLHIDVDGNDKGGKKKKEKNVEDSKSLSVRFSPQPPEYRLDRFRQIQRRGVGGKAD